MSIKAGIIGIGYMGNFHIRKCNEMGEIEIVSVYDTHPEKYSALLRAYPHMKIRCHATLQDFLDDCETDLVFICTPNDSHRDLSIACLRAGKNVMCEKPVCLNLRELNEVIETAEKYEKVFTSHQNRRWDVDYQVVRGIVDSGEIGNVTNIVSCVHGQRGVCFGWRADPHAGGGMLYDWGIHLIDQVLQLFKDNKVVSVYCRMLSVLTPLVDDYFELKITFNNNVCATIVITTFALQERPRWFVYGDRGTLKVDDFSGKSGGAAKIKREVAGFDSVFSQTSIGPSRTMAPLQPEYITPIPLPVVDEQPYEYHRNLAEAVKGDEKVYVSYQDMRRAMAVLDNAFLSAKGNEVIKVEI